MLKILKIQIEAIKFLEEVKILTVKNIEFWLSHRGYSLHFFSKDEIEGLGIDESENGFKRKSELLKIVYIKNSLSYKEKLETIIHECGHVLFDDKSILKSNNYRELQANMFSEYVADPNRLLQKLHCFCKLKYLFILLLVTFIGLAFTYSFLMPRKVPISSEQNIQTTVKSEATSENTVYITPTGKKYHKNHCFSIRNSNKIETTIENAIDNYTPCKLCNPDK